MWASYNKTGSVADRNKLIEEYWPLVQTVAREVYRKHSVGLSVDELASFGAIGLIEAVERFNPAVQESFEGYARIRIRGSILDELRNFDWAPRSIRMKQKAYQNAIDELTVLIGRIPTDEEVAARLKMGPAEFRRLLIDASSRKVQSIDAPVIVSDGSSLSLHDIIADMPTEESRDYSEAAIELINSLPMRERIILRLFYIEGLSIPEIADFMAFGESRASQIHASALELLRTERN